MRLVAWNIRSGGGARIEGIAAALAAWQADVITLSEFRRTEASRWLAEHLHELGYVHQRMAETPSNAHNGVFIAARQPMSAVRCAAAPSEPGRWLMVRFEAPYPLQVGVMHIPNQVTGRKGDFHEAVLEVARRWRNKPAIMLGDTNSGRINLDEENPVFNAATHAWFDHLKARGFEDAFRFHHGDRREYTWYSPNAGNGFRLDQAFLSRPLMSRLRSVRHEWARPDPDDRRDVLSDHAALIVDLHRP